jgi:hypothetical protein
MKITQQRDVLSSACSPVDFNQSAGGGFQPEPIKKTRTPFSIQPPTGLLFLTQMHLEANYTGGMGERQP